MRERSARRATTRGRVPPSRAETRREGSRRGTGGTQNPRDRLRPSTRDGTPAASTSRMGGVALEASRSPSRPMAPDRRRTQAEAFERQRPIRRAIVAGIVVATLALVGLLTLLVLSCTPLFTITGIDAEATDHMSADDIIRLANIPNGATLLNLDEGDITSKLRRNPWVGSVSYAREFPDRLRITVRETSVQAIVVMGTGNIAWTLGEGGVWIEPYPITVGSGRSINDVALARAQELGVLLITDAPPTVSPVAGHDATDDVIEAVQSYQDNFSSELRSQIVSYSIASLDSISCTLSSGVQVSLGAATDIDAKQTAISGILAKYRDKLTYINVRTPLNPSYRAIDSDDVKAGTGAVGASDDAGS